MKKTTIIKNTFVGMFALCNALMVSCVKDEGNYDYATLAEITVEGIPPMTEVLAYIDHIKISPKFYADGKEIANGDPRYTVRYRFGHAGMGTFGYDYEAGHSIAWKEFTPKNGFAIDEPAEFSTGAYTLWVTVTDNETGAVTSMQYGVNVGSTTYEGWLVLCNEGDDNRVRLDMISQLSTTRVETIHDICAGLPLLHNATCINAFPQGSNPGDQVHLFTREGSYEIDSESMEYEGAGSIVANHFAFEPNGNIIKEDMFSPSLYSWLQKYKVCFDDQENAYVMIDGMSGSAYSTPINTVEEGTDIQFKVAPFVGYNTTHPWDAGYSGNMLFYDKTNKRFMYFVGYSNTKNGERMQLVPLSDPTGDETALFSYSTGKELVFMQSTRRSNGLVCSVLKDAAGNCSIYGINMGGTMPIQELYVENVNATDISKATQFAFDNIFPLLFYAVDNKVYCYNIATKQTSEMQTGLAAGDKIVKLKFNLFRAVDYNELINHSEEFLQKQYKLIICTYNEAEGKNGGKVTFCDVDGVNAKLTPAEQYTGFGKIADIIYRERTE